MSGRGSESFAATGKTAAAGKGAIRESGKNIAFVTVEGLREELGVNVTLTSCSLQVSDKTTDAELESIGRTLFTAHQKSDDVFKWVKGDWYNLCKNRRNGASCLYWIAEGQLQTVRNYARAARAFPVANMVPVGAISRHADIPFWIHYILSGKGVTDVQRRHVLDTVRKHGMKKKEIEEYLGNPPAVPTPAFVKPLNALLTTAGENAGEEATVYILSMCLRVLSRKQSKQARESIIKLLLEL